MVAQWLAARHIARLHPNNAIMQRNPCARNGRCARSSVRLDDIAIDRNLTLSEGREIEHLTQAAPNQTLDFDGSPTLLAYGSLAARGPPRKSYGCP